MEYQVSKLGKVFFYSPHKGKNRVEILAWFPSKNQQPQALCSTFSLIEFNLSFFSLWMFSIISYRAHCLVIHWKSDNCIIILQFEVFCNASINMWCNSLAFIFSLSGWLQSSFVESPQMRSPIFIVLEWSCGSL